MMPPPGPDSHGLDETLYGAQRTRSVAFSMLLTEIEIVRLYEAGEQQRSIARKAACAHTTVRRILLRNGIHLPDTTGEYRRNGRAWGKRYGPITGPIVGAKNRNSGQMARIRLMVNEERRLEASRRATRGRPPTNGTGIGKGSVCKKGHWVRSTWERKFADRLFDSGIEYIYEPTRFELGGGLSYRPDFYVPSLDLWIEIKGYTTDRNREQFSKFTATGRKLYVLDSCSFVEWSKEVSI